MAYLSLFQAGGIRTAELPALHIDNRRLAVSDPLRGIFGNFTRVTYSCLQFGSRINRERKLNASEPRVPGYGADQSRRSVRQHSAARDVMLSSLQPPPVFERSLQFPPLAVTYILQT